MVQTKAFCRNAAMLAFYTISHYQAADKRAQTEDVPSE